MNIESAYRLIFLTDALTLFRAGELLALRWKNFDLKAPTLQATHALFSGASRWLEGSDTNHLVEGVKTKGSAVPLKIARGLALMLSEHREQSRFNSDEDFIFCRPDGRPYDPNFLRKLVLYPALEAAGIKCRKHTHGFHLFRHSGATMLAEITRDPLIVRDMLRHSQLSTTAGYVKPGGMANGASDLLLEAIFGIRDLIN